MYVRSLRIAGFKSFGDAVTFELDPAVNGIIGPNGSGKSNIADAVTWVLGSQAPSSLRSGSMEDVIFAGSQQRPRLGMAEVELTLDNSDQTLPVDVSEATITRSTDRSGASEYRINGVPSRLLDVAELLSDTGIGRSLHTVVGQGQLDAVLQARPEERRGFIEEAAQIGKFRRRKDRAVRKLERVEDNLMRLADVASELKRALRPLKRQAEASALFSELVAEHRTMRQRLAATEVHALAELEAAHDPAPENRRAALLGDELDHVRAALRLASQERESLAAAAAEALAVAHGIRRAADRLEALASLATERSAVIAAHLEAETEEGYRQRINLLGEESERFEAQSGELTKAANAATSQAQSARRRAETAAAARDRGEAALATARKRETAAAEAVVRAEGGEAAGRATLGSIQARAEASLERKEVAERGLQDDRRRLAEAETESAALERDLEAAVEAAAAAEAAHDLERDRLEDLRKRLGLSAAGRAAAEARATALREVAELFADLLVARARLDPLLEEAQRAARLAATEATEAGGIASEVEAGVEARWVQVAEADHQLRRLDARMSAAAERLAGGRRALQTREVELAGLNEELALARDALAEAERTAAEERAALPTLRSALEVAQAARAEAEAILETARLEATEALTRATAAELEARATGERALASELRVEEAVAGIADAGRALAGLEGLKNELQAAHRRAGAVAEAAGEAAARAGAWALDAERRARAASVASGEHQRRTDSLRDREGDLTRRLEETSEARGRAQVRRAEARARIEAVSERAMEEWGMGEQALLRIERLADDASSSARRRAEELERKMRALGGVNPRAEEEYEELAERQRFLEDQIEDLKSSKRDLLKIVREVDATIVAEFQAAFDDVAREFEGVFERLFPGGRGRLSLVDPGDPLTSGVEVTARPPGKSISKLSLLSGGERSLVALALLFAIFRARPSPFYLLDEVEAALDDVNLQRFIGLVAELRGRAQVLIVTHQRRTMEAADVLYGVSMGSDGVSRVIAKHMEATV